MKKLFDIMEKEVEKTVEHYKTDFYTHDKNILLKNTPEEKEFFWGLRRCGTELYRKNFLQCRGSYSNIAAKFHLEQKNLLKIFKITVEKVGRKHIYGKIEKITAKDFEEYIRKSERDFSEEELKKLEIPA